LIAASAIMGVLALALSSAMLIAGHSLDDRKEPLRCTADACDAVQVFAGELAFAASVPAAQARTITFTVPDRDGDAAAETITYAWNGTPGSALTRSYKGGTSGTVAANVTNFECIYALVTSSQDQGLLGGLLGLILPLPTTQVLQSVRVKLQIGTGATVDFTVEIFNRPVMP
jgi:hypothetical protein